jgi:uncharacterized membrane protein YfcA
MMDWLIVAIAGLLAGMLNAVAGGGSFITLPALVYVGLPPIMANTTGTAALLPGYIASAWRFRHDIEYPAGLSFLKLVVVATLGACMGAGLLLMTPGALFSNLIPWLILISTLAFVVGPKLIGGQKTSVHRNMRTLSIINMCALLVVCVYGGYFNGGLGIILLAVLGLMGQTNLLGMNGFKNIVSALLTLVAVCIYALGGTIDIRYLLLVGGASVIGGYLGATLAYRFSQNWLRVFIVVIGCSMSLVFFLREFG